MLGDDKKIFLNLLNAVGQLSGKDLTEEVVLLYSKALKDLPIRSVNQALMQWVQKSDRWPTIKDIRNLVNPELGDDLAQEVAGLIIKSISRFGHFNPLCAKEFIGDWGWLVVERLGGWSTICKTKEDQLSFLRNDARKLARSVQTLAAAGKLGQVPQLPDQANMGLLEAPLKKIDSIQRLVGKTAQALTGKS